MRRPNLSLPQYVALGTAASVLVVLPMTAASATFDDGDYSLSEACTLDATLKVRGSGNGISVHGEGSLFVHTERDADGVSAALVVDLGSEAADDNTVVTVTAADDDGLACTSESNVSDATVAEMIGLSDDEALEDEVSVDEASMDEASVEEEVSVEESEEATEKVLLCHKPDGSNPHDIEVSVDALDAHLAHGDLEGECPDDLAHVKQERKDAKAADREAAKAERDRAKADRKGHDDEGTSGD